MHHAGLRERKKERTRRALAAAALRLFAERGYEETTIADIAAAAEVSPRTFFAYFPSKEDVVFAEIDDRLAEIDARLADRPDGETPLETIRRGLVYAVRALVTAPGEYGAAQIALIFEHPSVQARMLQRMTGVQREVEERLRELCPGLDPIDAIAVGGIAVGAMQAIVVHCRGEGLDAERTEAALDRAIALVEHGIGSIAALRAAP
ncbi:TetR family transcriptional regulator [Actinomadura parmotrematis]|uniref:TetR/AcrR family transcriptional regulator n=1 Tax=Actinomadura parmotrematis TaxID=2864039 RepID=A0ABS7FY48_9ACTN|nr:TetR family transcriptional regulator [Actinomadura parmotrematis]MBW8485353.1 TetR/AcrR family transcriptional regulator [Actinomadura parmotrematis]